MFHADSYGYRPGKSAKQAIAVTRERCWRYAWVVEFDVEGAFDNLDHDLLMKAVRLHIKDRWALLYIERWLKAPLETSDGQVVGRVKGTPQGGVISPLLMNLFMNYAFDRWMQKTRPECPFARYADDAVAHCRSQAEAEQLLTAIGERMDQCKLTMHPEKSKVVYCKNSNRPKDYPVIAFTFLGFTFKPRMSRNKQGTIFTGFLPAASREAVIRMLRTIKSWQLQRQTPATIEELSGLYNPILRGWWNYYGSFYPSMLSRVAFQVDRKLISSMGSSEIQTSGTTSAAQCPMAAAGGPSASIVVYPLAAFVVSCLDNGSCMTRECHVQFCKRPRVQSPRPTYHR